MDKIKWKNQHVIRHLSLKKTLMLYLSLGLISSFFLSAILITAAEHVQNRIWLQYMNLEEYSKIAGTIEEQYGMSVIVPRISSYDMSAQDYRIVDACDFIETWISLIMSTLSAGTAVFLFYRNKLKKPLYLLETGSNNIAENNLDFHIEYENKDEMGRLCRSFEHMRENLQDNNKHLWRMIEEQKNLRAAIAHDIRAPLSVLKGYHEMMYTFALDERMSKDKIVQMVKMSEKQVDRLEIFVDTMRDLSKIEDRKLLYQNISMEELEKRISHTTEILMKNSKLAYQITVNPASQLLEIDEAVILEVFENLIENAIRFAENKILITMEMITRKQQYLQITVSDDGIGFQEVSPVNAAKPYYHTNSLDDLSHFGLGLYLCKVLCENHGGSLFLSNDEKKGACARALFRINQSIIEKKGS